MPGGYLALGQDDPGDRFGQLSLSSFTQQALINLDGHAAIAVQEHHGTAPANLGNDLDLRW